MMSTTVDCWIGLNDLSTEGTFVWEEDGSSPVYTNWYSVNPTGASANAQAVQDCVLKKAKQSGMWDDVGCNKLKNFACSMAADYYCGPTTTAFAADTTITTSTP